MVDTPSVAERLASTREEISHIERRSGRQPGSVRLMCVSKTQPPDVVQEALIAGQRLFGENRVQEVQKKWPELRARFPDAELHLIGPLQTNKVRDAVELFNVIETVDRLRLVEALAHEVQRAGRAPRFMVEVNTGAEPQKAGILPAEADQFIRTCHETYGLPVVGLMCIPPAGEQASPHFALLAQIAKRNGLAELSMGMSADYELAIQLGATCIRLGTAIFGART